MTALKATAALLPPAPARWRDLPDDAGEWYVAHGRPSLAWSTLRDRRDMGIAPPIEIFTPMETVKVRTGRARGGERREYVFGPYFFVRCEAAARDAMAARIIAAALALHGLRDFVRDSTSGETFWPTPVSTRFVHSLRMTRIVREERPVITRGMRVELLPRHYLDALGGRVGEVERLLGPLDTPNRVRVLLAAVGCSIPIDIPIEYVAPAPVCAP